MPISSSSSVIFASSPINRPRASSRHCGAKRAAELMRNIRVRIADWFSDLMNPGQWATVSSFVAMGLTWWESCLAIFVGGVLVSIVITANAYVGAEIHTPFAVTSRSVYGYWGSKFVVFSRMVIACFWLSINSWSGGIFVSLMIEAIWPQYARLHNSIPAGQGATSQDFLSFFLFWLLQAPFAFIHPSKLKWVFNIKAILVPVVAVGTLIYVSHNFSYSRAFSVPIAISSQLLRWTILTAITNLHANGILFPAGLNIGDFSRYCKTPRATYVQLVAIPFLISILSIFAAISASCLNTVYNTTDTFYQPYGIVALWNTSAGGRAAMFLASLVWALSNVTTNITANSISAANDMTSLAPKYINIRRGQMIAITVGVWGFAPWKVLASAANFLTFMASYSIVLAPIAALMAIDFFVVKKRKIDIYELYKPDGIYYFSKGWNWRSYVALVCAIAPNIPGMANAINAKIEIGNIRYVYMVSNIVGDFIAIVVYLVLNKFFPAREAQIEVAVHDLYPSSPSVSETERGQYGVQYAGSNPSEETEEKGSEGGSLGPAVGLGEMKRPI
ncbi:uracil transporter FurD [Kwoniella heveanensis CBS 569]|nr:uracil transporter FurD [Kwoniella heveanensis CBS 569]